MTSDSLSNTSTGSTHISDPWSEFADWHDALEVRKEWMRMMGLDENEIAEQCEHSPPTDMDEELSQYNAMFAIQEINKH